MVKKADSIILIGGFSDTIELAELCGKKILGIVDNKLQGSYMGYEVFGDDHIALELFKEFSDVPLIITPDTPTTKEKLVTYYGKIGFSFTRLIAPGARISRYAQIGEGVIIHNGADISAMVIIGNFVRVNTYAVVGHDTKVGAYTTIAPSVVILGRVSIAESCYIGANSTIFPEIQINKNVIVAGGAVVMRNVDEDVTVIGNPIREFRGFRVPIV